MAGAREKLLYVESARLNYNPPEFIGLLGLGFSGSHCLGIGSKFIKSRLFPDALLAREFSSGTVEVPARGSLKSAAKK